ncbi:variant erythrocyte surface antigen-1 beta subunit [Babesia bovis T2Bo]|uniref:Variant erythrocyte surface antigen-1, beta subunit n=1 Tax=Babesia bovis TaxID=5865 RepID=A7AUX2_BABBO|nr:variant erythrocyte surface antigen-1 beta subunit [Babesia bovis T2Bo]EDO06733.1 variant erythrocyte surface antigen-1 beta subunit [Babesia bovis T2Bo]|eukprot:XP_001610301.1 variant erythrocyte surface antigen-1, beta subunit [Babesia bovis T2Bo]
MSDAGTKGTPCASHECNHCGVNPKCHWCDGTNDNAVTNGKRKCYLSAYQRHNGNPKTTSSGTYYWPTISGDPAKVHLLARIFLGSVCLIWSGLSQLGFLTGGSGSGTDKRWKDSSLHDIGKDNAGLGSFMAAMGYDLDRLNGSSTG